MTRLLVDHPFSTINWWNSIIWMSETLRRIPLDELTLLSDNLGRTLFFFYKNIFYKNIEAEICEILRIF